nr:uncharacterized protein LOC109782855 isoform X2 [Aegilops tauschii subsp. strangulata]XP_020197074.1 uncharacterized protein LOC109782855 isoform X2 [Aegilops tauschii subsp. strangulata]
MASPARPASVSGPFGSAADLAIFSTSTTTRRVDPGRASETAARSSMARTCSGPRRPNQVRLLPQLSRFTGDLPRTTTTSDPFSLICSGGRLSHHRRRVLNTEIRRAKAKLLEEDPPKLHAVHSPPTSEGDVLTWIRVLLPKQPSPASPPSGQRRWRSTSPLPPLPQRVGRWLLPLPRQANGMRFPSLPPEPNRSLFNCISTAGWM